MLLYKLKVMTCSDFIVRLTEYSVTVESVTLRFYCTDDIINTYYPHRCIMWHFRKKIERHFSGSYTVKLTLPEIVHHFKSLSPAHGSGMSDI